MSNLIIATPVLSDAASLQASHAAAAGPVANLQRMQPSDAWQSSSLTPHLVVDLGAAVDFNLVALLFTNAQQSATWRVRMADLEANLTAAPDYDSGVVDFSPWDTAADRRHGFLWSSAGWTHRWIRIDLDDTGNPDGVLAAGRLYVANAYQPTRNYGYGNAVGFRGASPRDRTQGGNTIPNAQPDVPTVSFGIRLDNEQEFYRNTFQIQQLRGDARDVLVILDPDDAELAHDKLYYGLLSPTRRTVNERFNLFSQQYEIEGLV